MLIRIGTALGTALAVGTWAPTPAFALEEKPPVMQGPQPAEFEPSKGERRSGQRGSGKRHRRPTYERLPEELRDDLDDFIEQYFPEQFQDLYGEESQDAFYRRVNRMLPQMMRLMRLEQEDQETFSHRVEEVRISMKVRALARHIADAKKGEGIEEPTAKLRKQLERRFDLRQKIYRIEVKRLERRLAEARDRLDRRKEGKAELIDEQLDEILMSPRGEHRGRRAREKRQPPETP